MYKKILSVFAAVLTLILILTQIAPHSNLHNEDHNESKNILISSSIYNSINATLAGPIIIASGMSADTFLQKTLKDIFSEDVTRRITNYSADRNRQLVQTLILLDSTNFTK